MDLDDQITLSTPEGVTLQVTLAGIGSRFIAGAVDLALQGVLVLILVLVASAGGAGGALGIVLVVGSFAIWFFYPVAFELLGAGRTPGKRFTHLRVIRESGAPVDLAASAIRNLMRVLDGLLLLYLPTLIGIAVTARNQRPGDVAAGTVVIREPTGRQFVNEAPSDREADGPSSNWAGVLTGARWDASAVSGAETAAVRHFLARRDTLDPGARNALAYRLATGLRPKVTGAPEGQGAEAFLEQLAELKRGR